MNEINAMEAILSGLLIGIVSAMLGAYLGSKNKVGISQCMERREACIALIQEKLDSIDEKLDLVMKIVDVK